MVGVVSGSATETFFKGNIVIIWHMAKVSTVGQTVLSTRDTSAQG